MKILRFLGIISVVLLSAVLLLFAIKGEPTPDGSLNYQRQNDTKVLGPFESSGSTSRFALVRAIADRGSLFFTDDLAQFAAPDLVNHNGRFFSIFTPGVSFAALPLYMAGNFLGIPQLGAYATTVLIALLNTMLVIALARRLGSGWTAALIAGLLFLFGTNAATYALTLTQHHYSILVVLLGILLVLEPVGALRNALIGLLYGLGVLIDIPNGFMMLPIVLYALAQHASLQDSEKKFIFRLKLVIILLALGVVPPLLVFGWYNKAVTGSPTLLGQAIGRSNYPPPSITVATRTTPKEHDPYAPKYPFVSRFQLNGLYILLASNERGWLYYSPIVFIGLAGLCILFRKKDLQKPALLMLTTAGLNVTMYSMFGDPWGGWSFGPRYLLPGAAILSIGIAPAIETLKRHMVFTAVFAFIAVYSVRVAVLGAFTTTQVPPKQEAEHLVTFIPYTYEYNQQFIRDDRTGSLAYNLWFRQSVPLSMVIGLYQGTVLTAVCLIYAYGAMKTKFTL